MVRGLGEQKGRRHSTAFESWWDYRPAAGQAVDEFRPVHARRCVRVAFQIVYLFLDLPVIGPVVIPLAKRDVLAPNVGEKGGLVCRYAFAVLVFPLAHRDDDVGVSASVPSDNVCRSVGRRVIVHVHLVGVVCFLTDKSPQSIFYVWRVIVSAAPNAQKRLHL